MANAKKAPASNDAVAQTVSDYFAQKGARNEVFSTSDGNVFENLGFAKNHADTLEDKLVTPHTNASAIELVDEEEVEGDNGVAATQKLK
jgi:hypothetical protein